MKRTKIKRMMVKLLIMIMVFNIVAVGHVVAQIEDDEETIYIGDFNLYEYRADTYLKSGTVCNNIIRNMMTATFPSQEIVSQLDSNSLFQASVSEWKVAHFATKPSQIADGAMDEKGYYTAIILSVFKAETKNKNVMYDCAKKVTSSTNKTLSNIKKWVKECDEIELNKISKNQILSTISPEDQEMIKKYLSGEFKKNHPVLNGSNTLASDLSTIFNTVNTLEEAIELMASYIQVAEMADNMKSVLLEMYNQCPSDNVAMKSALYEAALSTDNLNGALKSTILNTVGKEATDVIGVLLDEGWKKLIQSNPYAKAFMIGAEVGTWLGDSVANTCFSTDKTVEQYEKMKCLGEFTALLRDVADDIGNTYNNNKSTTNANNYFGAIDALFSAADLSCDFAKNYGEILYEDASLGWLLISAQSYGQYVSSVLYVKDEYAGFEENLYQSYLIELQGDYPDIYEILMGIHDEDAIAVTGLSFASDSMVIGLNDSNIYVIEMPIITPSNATNQFAKYSTSDSSIVDINENGGFLIPKKEGTAIITATSEDGGYSDSITITVISGSAGSVPDVVASGSCGENVEWELYKNGTLIISGSGDMEDYVDNYYGDSNSPWSEDVANIKRVIIRKGLTSIGRSAFSGCRRLESIEIPSGVTSIGEHAFYRCEKLTSAEIPSGVTIIEAGAFAYCRSLAKIEIPAGVTDIWNGAFHSCSSLTRIEIPAGVTFIQQYTFYGCSDLTSIEIPAGVTRIGANAFDGCSGLISISIPSSVKNIEDGAFRSCSSLTSIEIPAEVTYIGWDVFGGCSDDLVIYSEAGSYAEQYAKDYNIQFVALDSVHTHTLVTDPAIAPTCTTPGKTEGSHCSVCGEIIKAQENIPAIGDWDYQVLDDGTVEITGYAGSDKVVMIPDTIEGKKVSSIGDWAFSDCSSLTSIEIPSGVTSIGENAFDYCDELIIICVKDSYAYTYALTHNIPVCLIDSTISPDDIEDDNNNTDNNDNDGTATTVTTQPAKKGTTLTVADKKIKVKVTSAKASDPTVAFVKSTNKNAKTITVPSSVKVDGVAYKVTSIADNAFKNNRKLKSVVIGKNVTSIGKNAFYNCMNLKSVTIPENVKAIGKNAFYGCKNLGTITIKADKLKSIGRNAFKGIHKKAVFTLKGTKKTKTALKKKLKKKSIGYVKTWIFK